MTPVGLLTLYCVLILLASLAGGWIPMIIRLTHRRMELAVSFVAGVMLGIALLDLLPHAIDERLAMLGDEADGHIHGVTDPVMLWMLGGFLVMFILERFFCFHHHDVEGEAGHCGHDRDEGSTHHLTWTGALVGLTIHSVAAGIALAASALSGVDAHSHSHAGHDHGPEETAALVGFGTFLVIFLHKPFDALTLGTLMAAGDESSKRRHIVNGLFALAIPLGVVLFVLGIDMQGPARHAALSAALAFSAGAFICISLSDLLPELQFHSHDRVKLTAALLIGLGLAWSMTLLERM